jgi:acyl-CoA reductase-like NAD-dependent aldehyde dehydrogenase
MLNRTQGQIVIGGRSDPSRRKFDVTVVRDVKEGDSLLEDEIFGPILAIVPVDVR